MPRLSLLLSVLAIYGVNSVTGSSAYVKFDPTTGTFTPSALTIPKNTRVTISSTDMNHNLQIAESSSLATPCIQASQGERLVTIFEQGYTGSGCSSVARTDISILYNWTQPTILYSVGGCQRGMVLSLNLPADDVLTLLANAKSSPKEVTNDLSYLRAPPTPFCPGQAQSSPNHLSNGAIAGIVVGSIMGVLTLVLVFIMIQKRRRQYATEEAKRVIPFTKEVDHHQKA